MLLCLFAADHGARYCQQHCEPVNMKAFDQSEHDNRIWYHGTAASKVYLQAPPPFPHPQSTRSARLARCYLSYLTRFFAFSLSTEPGSRLAGGVLLKGDPYPWVSLQNEVFLNQILLNWVPLLLRLCFGSLPGLFSNFRPFFPPVLRRPKYEEQRKGYYFKTWSERGRKRIHFINYYRESGYNFYTKLFGERGWRVCVKVLP